MHSHNTKNENCDKCASQLDDHFIDEKTLAARWQVSVRTLQNNRVSGTGVRFAKINSSVRYRLSDVIAHENLALRDSTSGGSNA